MYVLNQTEIKKLFNKVREPYFYRNLLSRIKFVLIRTYHEKIVFKLASKETVFTSIWRNNYWGNAESLSGVGATLQNTENLRQKMPMLFREYGIKTVFDAPCGDMNWMQYVLKNADFSYLGGDIVTEIVEKNKLTFNNQNVDFVKFKLRNHVFRIDKSGEIAIQNSEAIYGKHCHHHSKTERPLLKFV